MGDAYPPPTPNPSLQILACESNLSKSLSELDSNLKCTKDADTGVWSCECSDWDLYGLFQGIAIFILLFFTLGLPLYTMWLIRRNKPTGSPEDPSKRYNEDGELVDYTDDMYFQDVTHNLDQVACPYSFLYKGYERRWSSYKVWVMVMKLLVVLPVVFLFEKQVAQALVTLLILIVFAAMSMFTTPFVNPHADVMDISGRVSTAATVWWRRGGQGMECLLTDSLPRSLWVAGTLRPHLAQRRRAGLGDRHGRAGAVPHSRRYLPLLTACPHPHPPTTFPARSTSRKPSTSPSSSSSPWLASPPSDAGSRSCWVA